MRRRAKLFDVDWTALGARGWGLDEHHGYPGASRDDPRDEIAFACLVYADGRFNFSFMGSLAFLIRVYRDLVAAGLAPYVVERITQRSQTFTADTMAANPAQEIRAEFAYWDSAA